MFDDDDDDGDGDGDDDGDGDGDKDSDDLALMQTRANLAPRLLRQKNFPSVSPVQWCGVSSVCVSVQWCNA